MLHLFLGLAIHEERLDLHGRNRENVLAVRGNESRELWDKLRELAKTMAPRWPPASKLGAGARYIVNHFEKLIEGSSMFRRSLKGRRLPFQSPLVECAAACTRRSALRAWPSPGPSPPPKRK